VFQGGSVTNLTQAVVNTFRVAYGSNISIQPGAQVTTAGELKLGAITSGYSGSVTQNGGTLAINGVDTNNYNRALVVGEFPSETSSYTLNGGLLSVPNGDTVVPWDGNGSFSITGGVANLLKLRLRGNTAGGSSGTVSLSGNGALYLGAGGLSNAPNPGGIPATPYVTLSGGTLGAYANWSTTVPMTLAGPASVDPAGNTITLNASLSGVGNLKQVGQGTLLLHSTNTYAGGTTINNGVLQMGVADALPFGSGAGDLVISSAGTLDLNGFNTDVNGLSGNGTVDAVNAGGTLVVGNNDATSTFSGVLQNTNADVGFMLALTKVGGGTLTLAGTNTYGGGTTVNNGTLVVANSLAIEDGTNLSVGDPTLLGMLPAPIVPAAAVAAPTITPVPEPGSLALLAVAAVLAIGVWRRKGIARYQVPSTEI
jgi:autotransporter-associated beta strand protein